MALFCTSTMKFFNKKNFQKKKIATHVKNALQRDT